MEKTVFLTQAGFDKFKNELEYLRSYKRAEIANRLREAMRFDEDQVDVEYQMTKDEQSLVEGRIRELENLLARARVLESKKANGKILLGSTVTVKEEGRDPEEFTIVSSAEANSIFRLISDESPLGSSLLGRRVGDEIEVSAPKGILKFKILGVK